MSYTSAQDPYPPAQQTPTTSMYSGTASANMYGAYPSAAPAYGTDPYASSRFAPATGAYYPNYGGVGGTAAAAAADRSRFNPYYAQPGNQAALAASAYPQGYYYGAQNPPYDENPAAYSGGPYASGYARDTMPFADTASLTGSRYAGSLSGIPRPGMGHPMHARHGWWSGHRFNKYSNNQGMYPAPNLPYANAGDVTIAVNARLEDDVNLLLDADIQVVVPASSLARDVWQYACAQSVELTQAGYKPTGEIRLTTETVRGIEIGRPVNPDEPIRQFYRPEYLWVFTVFPGPGMPFNGGRMGRLAGNGYYGGAYGQYPNHAGRHGTGPSYGTGWMSSLGSALMGRFGSRYANSYDGGMSGYPSAGVGMPMGRFGIPRSRSVGSLHGMASDLYGGNFPGEYDAPSLNGGRAASFTMM